MALGSLVRRLLGPSLAQHVARRYRSIFVDLDRQAIVLGEIIPPATHLLDVGGGDGEPINRLLRIRPDLRVTTLDPAPVVGDWIEPRFSHQVRCLPRTGLADYLASEDDWPVPDVLLLSDVIHHVPVAERAAFLVTVRALWQRSPNLTVIVKDVEPGHWRSHLGYLSDRYITGDRGVSLVSREEVLRLFEASLGAVGRHETNLFALDKPNYAVVFNRRVASPL